MTSRSRRFISPTLVMEGYFHKHRWFWTLESPWPPSISWCMFHSSPHIWTIQHQIIKAKLKSSSWFKYKCMN
jgi:hypothetical protein